MSNLLSVIADDFLCFGYDNAHSSMYTQHQELVLCRCIKLINALVLLQLQQLVSPDEPRGFPGDR